MNANNDIDRTEQQQQSNVAVQDCAAPVVAESQRVSSRYWKQDIWVLRGWKILSTALSYLVLVICSLLVVEFILAQAHVCEDTIVQPDPLVGYSNLKAKDLTFRREGYSRSHINNAGMRDREFSVSKAPGVKRIAFMGDSMTVAFEVPLERTFSKLLERKYYEEGKKNIEVMNAGMSGFGTGQEYLFYLDTVSKYNPDCVVLSYNFGDVDDNVSASANPPRPIFSVSPEGNLKPDFKPLDDWLSKDDGRFFRSCEWLRRNSRILAALNHLNVNGTDPAYKLVAKLFAAPSEWVWGQVLHAMPVVDWKISEARSCVNAGTISQTPLLEAAAPPLPVTAPVVPLPAVPVTKTPMAPPAVPPLLTRPVENGMEDVNLYRGYLAATEARTKITTTILRDMNTHLKAKGGKLVLVGLPAFSNSIFYYRELRFLKKFCAENGIQYIDASSAYPARDPMTESPYFYDMHFNYAGHNKMADLLHSQLVL